MRVGFGEVYKKLREEIFPLPSRTLAFLAIIFLLILPIFVRNPYYLQIIVLTNLFALYAASWDLLSGYTGQVSFGHALFFGVGGYSAAFLNLRLGWPPLLTIPVGALAAVFTGMIVGIPCLRLRGPYLALATLAFPIILTGIIYAFPETTGGEFGLSGLTRLTPSRTLDYYFSFLLMIFGVFIMWKITESKIGIILHSIREDEIAARACGINTARYKLLAYSLSGFFAGLAGSSFAHFMRTVGPLALDASVSFQAVIWTAFGGIVSIYGAVGGVYVLYPLMEFLRVTPQIRMLSFAIIVTVILLIMPEGMLRWIRDKIERECPRCKKRNVVTRETCRICGAPLKD
ncbi:MAG: branched-chain amino acid ABC transporter permease [Hadesarchaea archaeon]|nr:MAG: branched-chain amino acid ABC transporter permease [Hadesarchaea archaeon]